MITKQNKEVIVFQGYRFSFQDNLKHGIQRWRGLSPGKCKAHLKMVDGVLLDSQTDHNHSVPDPEKLKKEILASKLRQIALRNIPTRMGQLIKVKLED